MYKQNSTMLRHRRHKGIRFWWPVGSRDETSG